MWRYLILLFLLIAPTSLPLLSTIGQNLEYEYALLSTWATLFLIPLYGIIIPRKFLPFKGSEFEIDPATQTLWIFLIAPVVAIIPPLWIFYTHKCPCSPTGLAFWMVFLWYPAWIMAHALLHLYLRLRCAGWSKSFTFLGHFLILLSSCGYTLWTLWKEPQKRILGFFTGFLHGPIYDEFIAMDDGLALARGAQFFLACGLLTLAWWRLRSYAVMLFTILLCALSVTLGSLSASYPSITQSREALERYLSSTLKGPGFTLHFTPESSSSGSSGVSANIMRIYRDTEFHLEELAKIFENREQLPHIEIYAYANEKQKKLLFGGGATDVTDVRTPSIHITADHWPHHTLRHELVHALASKFSFHGIGFHPNMAFTEGLAVALAPEARTISLDDGASSLIDAKRLPEMRDLFSPLFWRTEGARAYTVAGSFIKFIIKSKGFQAVLALYSGDDWDHALGSSRDDTINAWKNHITAAYDKERIALYAEALYRAPSLFEDLCPHTQADYEQDRDESIYIRLRQPLKWDPKEDYLPWLASLMPESPHIKIKLWKREIKRLGAERFPEKDKLRSWREKLIKARSTPPKNIEDIEIALLLSDVLRLDGDRPSSLKLLEEIRDAAKKRFIGDQILRETVARIHLEQLDDPLAFEWRKVLAGYSKNLPEESKDPPDFWLITYLRFRNGRDDQFKKEDLGRYLATMPPDLSLPTTFSFEWYRLLASRLMQVEDYSLAAKAYAMAAGSAHPASGELYDEHARRAKFYSQKGPLFAAMPKPLSR